MNEDQGLSRVFSLVLLIATAVLGWISFQDANELPGIVGDRQTVTVPASEQNVTARLWEDPLQAVQSAHASAAHSSGVVRESITNRAARGRKVCLLLVPIPATPFPDDLEVRLRLRYSAQMALAHENFAPENRDALGYFQIPVQVAPFSTERGTNQMNVPYEWFVPREKQADVDVLLLWLPEVYLGDNTLPRLSNLVDALAPMNAPAVNRAVVGVFIVGPRSSDTLKRMIPTQKGPEIGPPADRSIVTLRGKLCIFSPQATTPDPLLGLSYPLGESDNHQYLWQAARKGLSDRFLHQFGELSSTHDWKYFYNFIAPDDQLTDLLISEMALRGIDLRQGSTDKILLLAEADTAYGRSLPLALQASLESYQQTNIHLGDATRLRSRTPAVIASYGEKPPATTQLKIYRYLRGLDQQKGNQGEKSPSGSEVTKSPEEALTKVLNKNGAKALGDSQLDYAERLVEQIHREGDANEIKAVGVLGGDLYDKMILLRSLRSSFPGALFFTTDLDARMWHPKHLPFTRNLVVASAYGVSAETDPVDSLSSRGIAPFRDVYQVAVFRAFRAALRKAITGSVTVSNAPSPLLFELGRNWPEKMELAATEPMGDATPWIQQLMFTAKTCWSVVEARTAVPKFTTNRRKGWTLMVLGFATLLGLWIVRDRVTNLSWSETYFGRAFSTDTGRAAVWLLTMAIIVVMFYAVMRRVGSLPGAESWLWTQGVSVWPTEIIRLGIIMFVLMVLGWAWRRHASSRDKLLQEYFPGEPINRPKGAGGRISFLFQPWPGTNPGTGKVSAADVYQAYVNKARPWCRFVRVSAATAAYMLLAFGAMFVIDGTLPPRPHIRGDIARWTDMTLLMISIVCFLGLVFYVLDAVCLSARLLRGISAASTQWPPALLQKHAEGLRVLEKDLPGYLDVKFAAQKSRETGKLVLMPFVVQFLFIVSRSNYFDNWSWPGTLIAIFTCNVLLACTAWMILRRAARRIRGMANEELQAGLQEVARDLARLDDQREALNSARHHARSTPIPSPALRSSSRSINEITPAPQISTLTDASEAGQQMLVVSSLMAHERKVGLEMLQKEIADEQRGAYAKLFQDPALLALLIPTGLLGLMTILFRAFFGRI